MPIIDASVYVALFLRSEHAHSVSRAWFGEAVSAHSTLFAPVILLAETGAALSRGARRPDLARQAVTQLLELGLVELVKVSVELAERAAQIAIDCRIRGADAIYVALAEQLDDELVTLDQQQLERAKDVVKARMP